MSLEMQTVACDLRNALLLFGQVGSHRNRAQLCLFAVLGLPLSILLNIDRVISM